MWVYLPCTDGAPGNFVVGFYRPDGGTMVEVEHVDHRSEAMRLVHYLNGGNGEYLL